MVVEVNPLCFILQKAVEVVINASIVLTHVAYLKAFIECSIRGHPHRDFASYLRFVHTDSAFWEPKTAFLLNQVPEWIHLKAPPLRCRVYIQSVCF